MNPYDVLGLTHLASLEEAKKAFRRLAQKYHPDKGGSEAKFKEIKIAWEMIEGGWLPPKVEAPINSTFTPPPPASSFTKKPNQPLYPKSSGFKLPEATAIGIGSNRRFTISFDVSDVQAALYGCTLQFKCDGDTVSYFVKPNTLKSFKIDVRLEAEGMIGNQWDKMYDVTINVNIKETVK